jgi:hypothetical protein
LFIANDGLHLFNNSSYSSFWWVSTTSIVHLADLFLLPVLLLHYYAFRY